jgi:predicted nucleic acid-binding protein
VGSNIEKLLDLIVKLATPVTSDLAIEEARRNILMKRPKWAESFALIIPKLSQVESISFPLGIDLNEKDIPLLCAAIRSKCDYFLTGDERDFGHLSGKNVKGVRIVTLLQIAEILLKEEQLNS